MQKIDPQKLSITERVEKLNDMIAEGKLLEAFEKFYAEDVNRQQYDDPAIIGKDACRTAEENWVIDITSFKKAAVKNIMIGDTVSVIEREFEYTHRDKGSQKYTQFSMQVWNCDGQIINEFIHNNK